jgi:putrescine---pyruvate transaminase
VSTMDTDRTTRTKAEIRELARQFYIWPLLSREEIESDFPLVMEEGEGVRVKDVDGVELLDLMSTGSRASNLGYRNERMAAAIHEQMLRLHYGGAAATQSAITLELAAKLAELAPGSLTATVFTGSGSEANEAALKLARLYHRARGNERKYKVISRWDDFHGSVGAAQEASDWLGVRKPVEPGLPGFSRIPAPNCYRCPFDLEPDSCGLQCAEYLARHIEHEGPELVSAFLIEPVAQANGTQVPPPGYLQRVKEICERYEVLFVADEIITGFGRTGKWFGVQHWDVEPDIMTVAKAITAGYMPLAGTIVNDEIRDAITQFPDVHTFGGHAAASVAALTAIAIYEEEGLVKRAAELGGVLTELLQGFKAIDVVGDVRALGLWAAVDFTGDRATKAPLDPATIRRIVLRARELGVIVSQNGTAIELAPPTIITREDLTWGMGRFEQAIRDVCG